MPPNCDQQLGSSSRDYNKGNSTDIGSRLLEKFNIQSTHEPKISGLEILHFPGDGSISSSIRDGQEHSATGVIICSQLHTWRGLRAQLRAKTLLSWCKASLDSQIQINYREQRSALTKSPRWQLQNAQRAARGSLAGSHHAHP